MKNRGFTLLELLVVISIIGLLSSVILASVNAARKKAIEAKVVSDMHQLQTAMELEYAKTGKYPQRDTLTPTTQATLWGDFTGKLNPLVQDGFIPLIPAPPTADFEYSYKVIGDTYYQSYTQEYCGKTKIAPNTYFFLIRSPTFPTDLPTKLLPVYGYDNGTGGVDYSPSFNCVTRPF